MSEGSKFYSNGRPRDMRPGDIERAQYAIKGAQAEELGAEPDYSAMSDEQLEEVRAQFRERSGEVNAEYQEAKDKFHEQFGQQAEDEFKNLQDSIDSLSPKAQRAIRDIEEAKSYGKGRSVLETVQGFEGTSLSFLEARLYQPTKYVQIFSPGIQQGMKELFDARIVGRQRERVIDSRRGQAADEAEGRKKTA